MSATRVAKARPASVRRVLLPMLVASVLLAVLAAIALAKYHGVPLVRDATLPIRHVELVGELRHLTEQRARRLLGPVLGSNLIGIDMGRLRARLEAHPWVERAVVLRIWPDRLRIQLQERTPIARWNGREFIDAGGHRFDPDGEVRPDLPLLRGPDGHERSLIIALGSTREQLDALGLELHSLTLDERRAWTIHLSKGTELRLGREQFAFRLQRFADAFEPYLGEQMDQLAAIDLRYTNGFAVSWLPKDQDAAAHIDGGSSGDGQEG